MATVCRLPRRPVEGLVKLARLVVAPVVDFGCIIFFMRELDGRWPESLPPSGIEIRLGTLADLPALQSARHDGQALGALLRHRFERGDRAVMAIDGVHVLRSSWVSTIPTPIPEVNRDFVLRPDEAYLYDGYTRRDVRGRGIDSLSRRFIFSMLRREGYRRAYSYVRGNNQPALQAAARWQTAVAAVRYVSVLRLEPWVLGPLGVGDSSESTDPGTWPWLRRSPPSQSPAGRLGRATASHR